MDHLPPSPPTLLPTPLSSLLLAKLFPVVTAWKLVIWSTTVNSVGPERGPHPGESRKRNLPRQGHARSVWRRAALFATLNAPFLLFLPLVALVLILALLLVPSFA